MGLAEKRAQKDFEEKTLVEVKALLKKICGAEIPVEIEWGEISVDQVSSLNENFFKPMLAAMEKVCVDQFGKDAILEKFKKISIKYRSLASDDIVYGDGVLILELGQILNSRDESWWNSFFENNL